MIISILYDRRYGIARAHWADIQEVSRETSQIILIRGGKPATIPWIEKNYPGKPMELGFAKVSRSLGLLMVSDDESKNQVFRAGHYVLEFAQTKGMGNPVLKELVPVRGLGAGRRIMPNVSFVQGTTAAAQVGVVIDSVSGQPFTSDYDVAAIVDGSDFRWGRTFLSVVPDHAADGGKWNRTNRHIDGILAKLNEKMRQHRYGAEVGKPRFLHGTQAHYNGNPAAGSEDLIVFFPSGIVSVIRNRDSFMARTRIEREMLSAEAARRDLLAVMRENSAQLKQN